MIKKIMSIFEKFKKPEEYSEEYFRREQEKARKSVEKFERDRAVKIESIKNSQGFLENVILTCEKLGISKDEAKKLTDDASLYNYEKRKFYIRVNIEQIRNYVNSEKPKEILYEHHNTDDLASWGDYTIDIDSVIKIRYGGYQQYPESRDMSNSNFIPSNYKSESREGYYLKTACSGGF